MLESVYTVSDYYFSEECSFLTEIVQLQQRLSKLKQQNKFLIFKDYIDAKLTRLSTQDTFCVSTSYIFVFKKGTNNIIYFNM